MTYNVFGGTLNPTLLLLYHCGYCIGLGIPSGLIGLTFLSGLVGFHPQCITAKFSLYLPAVQVQGCVSEHFDIIITLLQLKFNIAALTTKSSDALQ